MATVRIACKLALGIVLDVYPPNVTWSIGNPAPLQSVKLAGYQSGTAGTNRGLPGAYGTTDVDQSFWTQWLADNATSPLVTSGSIYQIS